MVAAVLVAVAPLAGCIPQDKGSASEVEEGFTPPNAPPAFPETGPVPAETLVAALTYDLSTGAEDANLAVPRVSEAQCAAEQIVESLGSVRLAELGYRPATTGAALNDIDLTDLERVQVVQAVTDCVDLVTLAGALLMGDGHMDGDEARCMADGLQDQGLTRAFVESWVFGRPLDPLEGEGAFGSGLLAVAAVCLPSNAFTWDDTDLPGEDTSGTDEAPTTTVAGQTDGLSSRTGSASDGAS